MEALISPLNMPSISNIDEFRAYLASLAKELNITISELLQLMEH